MSGLTHSNRVLLTWVSGELSPLVIPLKTLGVNRLIAIYNTNMANNERLLAEYLEIYHADIEYCAIIIEEEYIHMRASLQKKITEMSLTSTTEVIANLTGGTKLMSIVLHDLANERHWRSIYVDKANEMMWMDSGEKESLGHLIVEQRIYLKGGDILLKGGTFRESPILMNMIRQFCLDASAIMRYRSVMFFLKAFYTAKKLATNQLSLSIPDSAVMDNGKSRRRPEFSFFYDLFQYGFFRRCNLVRNQIECEFVDVETKKMFFNDGQWFEVYMYSEMMRLQNEGHVRDLEVSVKFNWQRSKTGPAALPNELDILFVVSKTGQIGAISCKTGNELDKMGTKTLIEIKRLVEKMNGPYGKPAIATDSSIRSKTGLVMRSKDDNVGLISMADGNVYEQLKNWLLK
jgi:hypothetical protein